LNSLYEQKYHPLEVIVVDNASTDGSEKLVQEKFPGVKVIMNESNLGFGGGNNVGIQSSQGDYIMVLNNDARLDTDCIRQLKISIDKDTRYGTSAAKI
jgi:N-acetylglucosaminyl-diphospho-decaprenol L-rhamnosyltransferase